MVPSEPGDTSEPGTVAFFSGSNFGHSEFVEAVGPVCQ